VVTERETHKLELTQEELVVVRTALELLEDTFSKEEADQLDQVQALIAKLPAE
jgi:hypothetical protein